MNKVLLSAVSILSIGLTGAAYAQSNTLNTTPSAPSTAAERVPQASPELQERIKNDLNRAGDAIKDTYNDVKQNVQAEMNRNDAPSFSDPQTLNQRYLASNMIGKDVLNTNGDKIATVKDIIVEQDGRALLLVVQDGGMLGLGGRDAAFNYDIVVNRNSEGDVFVPLTQEQVKSATAFSYDPADASSDVRRIPQNGYSVAQILKSNIEDPSGKRVARVENVTFSQGNADSLIVAFDTILGMGGKRASLNFEDVQLMRLSDKDTRVRMNANQVSAFENFKQRQAK